MMMFYFEEKHVNYFLLNKYLSFIHHICSILISVSISTIFQYWC